MYCVCVCACTCTHAAAGQAEWNNWLPIDPPPLLRTVLSATLQHRLISSTLCVSVCSVPTTNNQNQNNKVCVTRDMAKKWIWEAEAVIRTKCWITHTQLGKWNVNGSDSAGFGDSAGTRPLVKWLTQGVAVWPLSTGNTNEGNSLQQQIMSWKYIRVGRRCKREAEKQCAAR